MVYDVFLVSGNEPYLDLLLEMRLHELARVVHKFVIVEFDTDHQGRPKEYALQALLDGPEGYRWVTPGGRTRGEGREEARPDTPT